MRISCFPKRRVVLNLGITLIFCLAPAWVPAQSAPSVRDDIKVYVSVMDPQTVSDVFGKRIAQRFLAIQVTIRNRNKDYQFLIHDVSLDLEKVFPAGHFSQVEDQIRKDCIKRKAECEQANKTREISRDCGTCPEQDKSGSKYELSSLELSLLRGVAEIGQSKNGRNRLLRYFEGIGTVAAGLIGIAGFGPSYGDSVALYNGEFLAAYRHVYPDYTVNQMNRLSDSAYQSNTLVPKQQAKVIVGFIPQRIFLTKKQRDDFWNEPTVLFEGENPVDFRRTEVAVRGSFIEELGNLPPTLNSVQFDETELKKFQNDKPVVKGYIKGRFSTDAKINLLNQQPQGLTIKLDGTPTSNQLNFIIQSDMPVPPDTLLVFEVSNDQAVQTITRPIHYTPDLPTVTDIDIKNGQVGTSELEVEITGTNFIPGKTRVLVSGKGVKVPNESIRVLGANKLQAEINIDEKAETTQRQLTIVNPAGQSKISITFTVVPKP